MFRVGAHIQQDLSHARGFYNKKGRLSVIVHDVDRICRARWVVQQVLEDMGVAVGGGGVKRGVGELVRDSGRELVLLDKVPDTGQIALARGDPDVFLAHFALQLAVLVVVAGQIGWRRLGKGRWLPRFKCSSKHVAK